MLSTGYSCQILMNLKFTGQFFEKYSNIKLHFISVQWEPSCPIRTDGRKDGQTDRHDKANSRSRNFANVHYKNKISHTGIN